MKSTFASVLVAALAGLANAKIALTNSNFAGITVGQPFTITWTEATGPVTILLKNGPSDDLATVSEIASGVSGTSFTWTPESTIASGNYALEIEDGTDINFSAMFPVTGGTAPTPSAASTTMSMASTTSIATATSTEESSSSVSAESSESSSTATEAATTTSESGSSSSATTMTTKASSSN
ncbi:Ser-Thr-rich glycosyl-phosphatidyl-inositol-anchored membrane family-domain-containing protein [Xylariomycetidae sp. FL0641]|nr:Ser-Thr-rich glycosyl-phosphatidyl-inositol-anchored membrane family-domain-containing protein [Xylariomycetidae sp. FL0641]